MKRISPESYAELALHGSAPSLIDVRDPEEVRFVRIANSIPIPLQQWPGGIEGLDRAGSYVVHCHHEARALAAAQYMVRVGFSDVGVMEGGIDAWAQRIDPTMPRY